MVKINLLGADYMPQLLEDISFENIPERCGGGFKLYNEHYEFDRSPSGPLHYEGCPKYVAPFPEADLSTLAHSGHHCSSKPHHRKDFASSYSTSTQDMAVMSMRRLGSKELTVLMWLYGLAQHSPAWMMRNPLKALSGLLLLLLFAYLRISGWLQILVFPAIIYITLFNTKPLSVPFLQYFDLNM